MGFWSCHRYIEPMEQNRLPAAEAATPKMMILNPAGSLSFKRPAKTNPMRMIQNGIASNNRCSAVIPPEVNTATTGSVASSTTS